MKSKIREIVGSVYKDGQTDGMKLYKKEDSLDFVFAANKKDAAMKYKAGLTTPRNQVSYYIDQNI